MKQRVWITSSIGLGLLTAAFQAQALPPRHFYVPRPALAPAVEAEDDHGGGAETIVIGTAPRPGTAVLAPGNENSTVAWLGVATDEAPEALTAQLSLDPGTGLLVNHVSPESPAAKAGLKKNDLLVQLDDQRLVHPAQLRKLVQVRKEGDEVQLAYYRAGKKETISVKLGKTKAVAFLDPESLWKGDFSGLKNLNLAPIEKQMLVLKDSLGNLKLDQQKVQEEVRRSMEAARRELERTLKQSGQAKTEASKAAQRALEELRRAESHARANSVVVKSGKKDVRSMVKSDDEGTLLIVSHPKPRLTAHDKDGKLLFDGPVSTPEERAKVPAAVMERAAPMLEDFGVAEDSPKPEQE